MANQDHLAQVLVLQDCDHVAHVGLEVDLCARQVSALPDRSELGVKTSWPADRSSGRTHLQACAGPSAMHNDERRHPYSLCPFS